MIGDAPRDWTLRFRDREREVAFMDDYAREARTFYRVGLIAVILLWGASAGFDFAAAPEHRGPLLVIRFAVVMPVVLLALAVGFMPWRIYRRFWQVGAVAVYLAVQAGVAALVVWSPDDEMSQLVVGGYLVTVLTGAALDLARAIYIIGFGLFGAIGMILVMAFSRHFDARALAIESLWIGVALLAAGLVSIRLEHGRRRRFIDRAMLDYERARSEKLLNNLLPLPIAARLKDGEGTIADALPAVTVLFSDLKGFTQLATSIEPGELVERLDRVFSCFDDLAVAYGLEKIKTIGDAYMAVAGAPFERGDHAVAAARMGLAMIARLREIEPNLELRVGLASGPAVAGVIGRSKYSYDLWGETVNLASRMESHGVVGRVQLPSLTRTLIGDALPVESHGRITGKGIGEVDVFLLIP